MGPDVNLNQTIKNKLVSPIIKMNFVQNILQSTHMWRNYKVKFSSICVFSIFFLYYISRSPMPDIYLKQTKSKWTWICDQRQKMCLKLPNNNASREVQSENRCKVTCAPEKNLWPLPVNYHLGGKSYAIVDPDAIIRDIHAASDRVKDTLDEVIDFQITKLVPRKQIVHSYFKTFLSIDVSTDVFDLDLDTNEHYQLQISCRDEVNSIKISSSTYFGARHGLETLFQLIYFDNFRLSFLLPCDVDISDGPYYKHRGVMLDTARNFISVDMIKTLIDSMSYSKMNVFHWHLTDSQSFPLHLDSLPEFVEYGAYSPEQTYNKWEVEEIVRYANKMGVRVLPEFDSPAHVGAGWEAVDPAYTLCVNREPWEDWCIEPPCGQLNPTQSGMYDVLENIYRDMVNMFGSKQFHLGGDEIHLGCWNSSSDVLKWLESHGRGREESDFMFLWKYFLKKSVKRIKKAGMTKANLVYWTNGLTKSEHIHHLDPKLFTIQIWSNGQDYSDATIKTVAEAGFKMIFSNYDATYLDCGFGGWVTSGNNWCSPYKEWQLQHQNDPIRLLEMRGLNNLEDAKANVLGGEVAMWTEQVDGHTMMTRIEPRASAYAERLWRGPYTGGWVEATTRLVRHRDRLVSRGIPAETLTQGWCKQNEGKCVTRDSFYNY